MRALRGRARGGASDLAHRSSIRRARARNIPYSRALPEARDTYEAYRPELEELGAEVRLLDIERSTAEDFTRAFDGCRAVVFAAGAGPDGKVERKRTVDFGGSLKSIDGAKGARIRRFVQVSAMAVDDPVPADASPVWRAYIEAKREADEALRASGLDWTILRPGWLTDHPGRRRSSSGETSRRVSSRETTSRR